MVNELTSNFNKALFLLELINKKSLIKVYVELNWFTLDNLQDLKNHELKYMIIKLIIDNTEKIKIVIKEIIKIKQEQ